MLFELVELDEDPELSLETVGVGVALVSMLLVWIAVAPTSGFAEEDELAELRDVVVDDEEKDDEEDEEEEEDDKEDEEEEEDDEDDWVDAVELTLDAADAELDVELRVDRELWLESEEEVSDEDTELVLSEETVETVDADVLEALLAVDALEVLLEVDIVVVTELTIDWQLAAIILAFPESDDGLLKTYPYWL